MKQLLKYKWVILGVVLALLLFSMLVGFHFYDEQEKAPEIEKNPVVLPGDDELEFVNSSSMSDEEVEKIVTNLKADLRKLFYETMIYDLKEIDPSRTDEENETFVVFDEEFLQTLNLLVTDNIYYSIFNQMTLLTSDSDHTFYLADRDIFESIYLDSAIAEVGIISSNLRLVSASDNLISATVLISACDQNKDCDKKASIPFELKNVNGTWKVNVFQ